MNRSGGHGAGPICLQALGLRVVGERDRAGAQGADQILAAYRARDLGSAPGAPPPPEDRLGAGQAGVQGGQARDDVVLACT